MLCKNYLTKKITKSDRKLPASYLFNEQKLNVGTVYYKKDDFSLLCVLMHKVKKETS